MDASGVSRRGVAQRVARDALVGKDEHVGPSGGGDPPMIEAILLIVSMLSLQQRDTVSKAAGAASITGVVVSTDAASQPVRRAIVSCTGSVLRSAVTDDQGRFSIPALPAGSFTVTASKATYVSTAY